MDEMTSVSRDRRPTGEPVPGFYRGPTRHNHSGTDQLLFVSTSERSKILTFTSNKGRFQTEGHETVVCPPRSGSEKWSYKSPCLDFGSVGYSEDKKRTYEDDFGRTN